MATATERSYGNGTANMDEKNPEHTPQHQEKAVHNIENLPDPDAGLSAEERAVHVSTYSSLPLPAANTNQLTARYHRTASSSANWTGS